MKTKLFCLTLFLFAFSLAVPQQKEMLYKYNTSNSKYHRQECRWAVRCTKSCIDLTLVEIKERKGIPCKVCKPPKY